MKNIVRAGITLTICMGLIGCSKSTSSESTQPPSESAGGEASESAGETTDIAPAGSDAKGPREKIAIIGTGQVGGALGKHLAMNGHTVHYGSRDPAAQKVEDLVATSGTTASAHTVTDAVAASDLVILAVPWSAAQGVVESIASGLQGKILIDATNPYDREKGLVIGHTTSAGEQVASWATGAKVVKAFNTTSFTNMADPDYGAAGPPTMFIAGDDKAAKDRVSRLVTELGFELADSGPLRSARYLEPLAMLYIHMAFVEGWGRDWTFKVIRKENP